MTQEEKQLLLKDLCARLPYGVRGVHRDRVHYLMNVDWGFGSPSIKVDGYDAWFPVETFKPYLRPMSSMTEEEKQYKENYFKYDYLAWEYTDWLNKKMFDFRGLIPMGLALVAKEEMYKMKEIDE